MAEAAQAAFGVDWEQIKLQEVTMNENELHKALGPLLPLYQDHEIGEILVDAPDRVYVDRSVEGEWQLQDVASPFKSPEDIRSVMDAILGLDSITLGPDKTYADVRFPDSSRMMAMIPPTAIHGPCLVIRHMLGTLTRQITWDNLIKWGAVTQETHEFLQNAIRANVTLLIAGGTNSGKTTMASRVAELVPSDKRLIVVEGVHEMQVQHPRCLYLEAGGPANVPFADLIEAASRMRPDWLIFGEVWGPEALRATQIMSRGHTGLMNMHADSTEDALTKLEAMCLMANMGLGLAEIRRQIASALRLIVYQERLPSGRRKITQITELRGLENDRYVLVPLFRFNAEKDILERTSAKATWEK
jgi:pilus assembly protein CpaF